MTEHADRIWAAAQVLNEVAETEDQSGAINDLLAVANALRSTPAAPQSIRDALYDLRTHSHQPPIGEPCGLCAEPIVEGDRGTFINSQRDGHYYLEPEHRECALRNVLGGIEHLTAGPHAAGTCYDGSTLSYRESARQAWDWWMAREQTGE